MSHQSLVFDGSLELVGSRDIARDGFWFVASGDGASWGDPQPVEVALNSLLRDGALTLTERDGNREVSLLVVIRGVDSKALGEGVAALHRSIGKRTTLAWTPPDGMSAVTVFDVETSSLHEANGFDDLAFKRNEVPLRLRLVCLPYARSATPVSEVAGALPASDTVVNSCQSTSGWSSPASSLPSPSAMFAVDAAHKTEGTGSISVQPFAGQDISYLGTPRAAIYNYDATVTGMSQVFSSPGYMSVDVRVSKYLSPDYNYSLQTVTHIEVIMSTGAVNKVYTASGSWPVIVQARDDDWVRYTWQQTAGTVTGLRVRGSQQTPEVLASSGPYPAINIDRIAAATASSGGRQILQQIPVKGSARSTGSVHVAAPLDSVSLGQVVAFTVPQSSVASGFRPDLRQWYVSGTKTTDSTSANGESFTSFSGSTYGATNSPIFLAPAALFSGGAYTVVARLKPNGSSTTFGVQAALEIGGSQVGLAEAVQLSYAGTAGAWGMVPLGTIYLPPSAVQNPTGNAKVRFSFKGSGLTAMDDVYVFPVEGDLTIVDCGSGTVGSSASSHLWIDSPSAEQPQGGYWRSTTAQREDALSAWSVTSVPGTHSFAAETMLAFVACTNANGPTVVFDYHPAWFLNAPE